jgi:23S rRNA G2445 N2-methylase RlmL
MPIWALFLKVARIFIGSGIEFNAERAANAKTLLDHVVHADFNDCTVSSSQFNLLWLNPPYGDRITDLVVRDQDLRGRDRWEKYFLNRSLPMLSFGGLLIYIIPHYVIDRHLAKQLTRCLDSISVYRLSRSTAANKSAPKSRIKSCRAITFAGSSSVTSPRVLLTCWWWMKGMSTRTKVAPKARQWAC